MAGDLHVALLATLSRTLFLCIAKIASMCAQPFDKSALIHQSASPFKFLLAWDAFHFLEISEHGYSREQLLAFFPLTPLLARAVPLLDNLTSGVLVSNIAFIMSAVLLHRIGGRRYSEQTAYIATLLFILNPASIVYSGFYSESLFCLLFLAALELLSRGWRAAGALILGMCGLCRSNAVLFVVLVETRYMAAVLAPFIAFQAYSSLLIHRWTGRFVPLPYSYVQKKYWEQGLFRFYTLKNIPNLLAGAAFVAFGVFVCLQYCGPRKGAWLNYLRARSLKEWVLDPFSARSASISTQLIALVALQLLVVFAAIHWNMALRFISYNPVLYWAGAMLVERYHHRVLCRAIVAFLVSYAVVYAILFGAFYPPA